MNIDIQKYLSPPADACKRCNGCGQLANDDDQSPWWNWETLPEESKLAVHMGLVRPVPCPECSGTGKRKGGK